MRRWTARRAIGHLLGWALALTAARIALVPAEVCPAVDVPAIDAAIAEAGAWAERNMQADGRFLYGYDRATGTRRNDYNLVRHAGMTDALYLAVSAGHTELLPTADRGLDYMLDSLVVHDDWAAFSAPGYAVKLGGTGLFVAALIHRRDATGDDRHDELIAAGARFLVAQQEPSGALLAFWDRGTGRPVPGAYGAFGTGEAMWALAMAGELLDDRSFTDAARRTGEYIATSRRSNEGLVLRIPDHWAAYAFDELGGATSEAQARYLERLAGDFGLMTRYESQRTGAGLNLLARGGPALGAGVGALGEGLGGLWRLSAMEPALARHRDDLGDRLLCTAGMLVDRQTSLDDARSAPDPGAAQGAWFWNDATLVDDQQHTLSALVAAREVLLQEGDR